MTAVVQYFFFFFNFYSGISEALAISPDHRVGSKDIS